MLNIPEDAFERGPDERILFAGLPTGSASISKAPTNRRVLINICDPKTVETIFAPPVIPTGVAAVHCYPVRVCPFCVWAL